MSETQNYFTSTTSSNSNASSNSNEGQCTKLDATGVDLNRNFDFLWGRYEGSSIDPCDATFRGRFAASEPEVQAVTQFAKSVFPLEQQLTNTQVQEWQTFTNDDQEEDLGMDIETRLATELPIRNEATTKGVFIDIHSYGSYFLWVRGCMCVYLCVCVCR
jgi:hypothetical protein